MEQLSKHIVGMENMNLENGSYGKAPENGNQSELPQDYSKLTQEQLIQLLQSRDQQLAAVKQEPKRNKKENRKMIDKPNVQQVKQKKKNPLEEYIEEVRKQIADQVEQDEKQEAAFRVQEQKMEKSKTGRDIMYYPKISVSLDAFRRDEASKVNNFKQGSSFADLFENRLDQIPGDRVLLSVQPFVTIDIGEDHEEDRTFGPFDIEIPELDGKEEMYKVFMLVLLTNNFNLQSGQMITELGAKVMTYNKQFLMDHYMMGVKLESHLLSKYGKIKSTGKYSCTPDYLWDQCKGKRRFKSYSRDKFTAELMPYASECVSGFRDMQFSTRNIILWAKECHPNVSIHAFDARYQKFATHIAPTSRDITLVFIVKDHHLFPITDEQLKTLASKANQGGAKNLLKYMAEVKWRRRNENVQKLKKMKHIVKHDKKDAIVILPEEVAMQEAAKLYCDKSNFYIEYLHWSNNGILDGFIDERNNMYLLNEDYDKRKAICEAMFEKFKTDPFIWVNQSYTQLATSIFRQIGGKIPESCYNDKTRCILDDFSPRALQHCTTDKFPTDVDNFDICKCYPSVLLNNEYKIPVYDIHDVIVPFGGEDELDKIGEFYIDESVVEIHGNPVKIEAAFYSNILVQFLVQEFDLPLSQIKWQITTKKYLEPSTFEKTIKFYFENFLESEAKIMANSFIGELGRKYNKTNSGFTSTDYDTAMCCWTLARAEGRNLSIDEYNGLFFIREQHCQRLFSDNTSVNRFVISGAVLQLLQLMQASIGEESKLVAYNTDGIFVTNPKVDFPQKKSVEFKIQNIGNAYKTDSKPVYFEKKYRENLDFDEYEIELGKGQVVTGQAGSGKTTLLTQMVSECDNPIVLSFTNKAVENVKMRLCKVENLKHDPNKICHTFDSFFCEWNEDNFKELRKKTVFVEEYSMAPNKWITLIYKAFLTYKIEVNMFGDPNQCDPVDEDTNLAHNYLESASVQQMCPNLKTLEYVAESCRYDKKTNQMLDTFLKLGKVAAHFEPFSLYWKNICFLNSTRKKVNEECCAAFSDGKSRESVTFIYNGGRERYMICVMMPFLATKNLKEDKVFNMMEFKLEDIRRKSGLEFLIAGKWYGLDVFASSFIPAFCVTVYKYQGADIDEDYNIYDVGLMDKKQLYTALSRTTKLKYIHLCNKEVRKRYFVRKQSEEEVAKTSVDPKYNNGKIYKIKFSNGEIFVGSTILELEERLQMHLADKKSIVYKKKLLRPKIELVINAPCFDKKTLESIEMKWIDWFAQDYGKNLVNVRGNTSRRHVKRKTVVHEASIETDKQLQKRVQELEGKIVIHDRPKIRCMTIDAIVDGKRCRAKARYCDKTKEQAFEKISVTKQKMIKELTINW